jgi:hypothetical protein
MLERPNSGMPTTKKLYETRLNNPRFRHVRWGRPEYDFELGFDVLEPGNVCHEHEFKVWRDVKLLAGRF